MMKDPQTAVEIALNDYPIKGFKFSVPEIEYSNDFITDINVRLKIRGNQTGDGTDMADIITWFYLVLDDYSKKINAHSLEFNIHQDKYINLLAEIETRDVKCIST